MIKNSFANIVRLKGGSARMSRIGTEFRAFKNRLRIVDVNVYHSPKLLGLFLRDPSWVHKLGFPEARLWLPDGDQLGELGRDICHRIFCSAQAASRAEQRADFAESFVRRTVHDGNEQITRQKRR
jgi:hypothetical protein